jgi:hypothetical protein
VTASRTVLGERTVPKCGFALEKQLPSFAELLYSIKDPGRERPSAHRIVGVMAPGFVFKESPIHCKERLKPGAPGATHHPSSQQHDARARASPAPRERAPGGGPRRGRAGVRQHMENLSKTTARPKQRSARVAGIYLDSSKMC